MPIKTVTSENGKTFKFGRNVPAVIHPHLHLSNYILKTLPAPPLTVDYSVAARDWLAEVLDNDRLGDCLDAAVFHIGGVLLANAGEAIPFNVQQVVNFYSDSAGYVPGRPTTDVGGTWQRTLAFWQSSGLTPGAHQIEGSASVNALDQGEVQTALWLFENLCLGMALPDEWVAGMRTMRTGFVWDVAGDPNPENGHAVCAVASDPGGLTIDTWGMLGKITWPAVRKYCVLENSGELYTALSREAINTAKGIAPNGFSFSVLEANLHNLAHTHHHHPRRHSPLDSRHT